jgi:hypothetical protein
MMRSNLSCLIGLAAICLATAATAETLDASKPLTCMLNASAQCDTEATCIQVTLEQIDLSKDLRVDFANGLLSSKLDDRTSPIDDVDELDTVLVLQGHQNGRGWTMVIDRASGNLSAALAESAGAFVLSGECRAD